MAFYVALVAITVTLLLAAIYLLTARALDRDVSAVIDAEAEGLLERYETGGSLLLADSLALRRTDWTRTGAVYLLVDADLVPQAGNLAGWPKHLAVASGWAQFTVLEPNSTQRHPVRARIVRLADGNVLLVGTDLTQHLRLLRVQRLAAIWTVLLTTVLVVALGLWYARRNRDRVRSAAASCERIMSGDFAERLPVAGVNDEFDALAQAVNQMLVRIETQTRLLRTTFDSAAHDLRTPLYRMRVRLEEALLHDQGGGAIVGAIHASLKDVDHVQRTLSSLLQIARADGDAVLSAAEAVDLGQLSREMVELYLPDAEAQGMTLRCEVDVELPLRGSRQLLAQLLANLIENAIKYGHGGGEIVITARADNGNIVLSVADRGQGIPPGERERVLRPFERLHRHDDIGGSGLGLSVVAAIVRLHRGTLALEDNHPGLLVRCVFPGG
ncbi:MAG: HAMP domain-containing sensor histidine kinase [Steroidobacteraceae bacterium]